MPALRPCVTVLTALALAAAGCGGGGEERESSGSSSGSSTIEVDLEPGLDKIIHCPSDGRCGRIAAADFSPVPADKACTEVYGGDATATVTGAVGGKELDAEFRLNNGCEIARWREFAWLLGEPPASTP